MVTGLKVLGWYDRAKKVYEADPPLWVGVVVWAIVIAVGALLIDWLG